MVPLVERDGLLKAIDNAFGYTQRSRQSSMLILTGPAGIGKTAVLDAFSAKLSGALAFRGRAETLETDFPYGIIIHAATQLLLRSADPGIRAAAGSLARVDVHTDGASELSQRLWRLLRLTAPGQVPVLVLDDLHDADRETTALIARILRGSTSPAFILAGSRPLRDGEPRHRHLADLLERLGQDAFLTTIELEPLSGDGVRELGTAILGVAPTELLNHYVIQACGGIPFHTRQLFEALRRDGRLIIGSQADLSPHSLAAFVEEVDVESARIPPMGETQETVCQALAVVGRCRIQALAVLARITGLAESEVRMALYELQDLGLVRDVDSGWIEFRHPILRSVIYTGMTRQRRARYHDLIAANLHELDQTPDPFAYATHLHRGAAATVEQRLKAALTAGEAAYTSAPLVAEHWFGKAANLLPAKDDRRVALLQKRTHACLQGGATLEAIQHGQLGLAEAGPNADRDELTRLTSWSLFFNNQVAASQELIAAKLVQDPQDPVSLGNSFSNAMQLYHHRLAAQQYPQVVAAATANHRGPMATLTILGELILYTDQRELTLERDQFRDRARELLPELPPLVAADTLDGLGLMILGHPGALTTAAKGLAEADRLRGEPTARSSWGFGHIARGNILWLQGQFDEVIDLVDTTMWSEETGGNILAAQSLRSVGAIVLAQRGLFDRARQLAEGILPGLPSVFRITSTLARSLLLPDEAAAELLWNTFHLHLEAGLFSNTGFLADELLRRTPGALEPAQLAAMENLRQTSSSQLNRMLLSHGLGRLRHDPSLLQTGLGIAVDEGIPFEEARIRLSLAEVTGDSFHTLKAIGIFERLAARPWHDRAARLARAQGHRVHLPRQRNDGLNETELSIVRLVVEGRSNREIADLLGYSEKRVEARLTAVFRRLGVRNRHELITLSLTTPDAVFGTKPQ